MLTHMGQEHINKTDDIGKQRQNSWTDYNFKPISAVILNPFEILDPSYMI